MRIAIRLLFGAPRAPCGWQMPIVVVSALVVVAVLLWLGTTQVTASPYSDQVIADGAVHYWRFEETSTDQDAKDEIASGAGHDNNPGEYVGGIELGQDSAQPGLGKAALFDGENDTQVDLGVPDYAYPSITVEAWFNLDADFTTSFSPIVARWDGSFELDINATDNDGVGIITSIS